MGIQTLKSINSGGIDWSKYNPLTISDSFGMGYNQTKVIADISGEGFFTTACFDYTSVGSVSLKHQLRVTIDGQVKILIQVDTPSWTTGILSKSDLTNGANYKGYDRTHVAPYIPGPVLTYPTIKDLKGYVLIDKPLFFKKSLKVEIINTTSSASIIYYDIIGGIK